MKCHILMSGLLCVVGQLGSPLPAAEPETWGGTLVQYGKMHDAIGRHEDQGRVAFKDVATRPHFHGVTALAGLAGEATNLNGKVTITRVDAKGRLDGSVEGVPDQQASLLIGASVPVWTDHAVTADVESGKFDQFVAATAAKAGLDPARLFPFTVEGEFSQVRLHVINGACPLHARLRKIELPKKQRPYEADLKKARGTIVGIFARDAVGNLTHPDTSTHMHLLFQDSRSDKVVTGHLEQARMLKGAVLRLPKTK